jgi:transcription initiation factor TFIIIB Brf1 subunit/transcription initiation factor TFIIB
MITIEETVCPQCGSPMEFFMRDGMQIADAVCDNCRFVTEAANKEGDFVLAGKDVN